MSSGFRNGLQKKVGKPSSPVIPEEISGSEKSSDVEVEEKEDLYSQLGNNEDIESDEEDVNAPRVSQWVDEDKFEGADGEASGEDDEPEADPSHLVGRFSYFYLLIL
jgi:hypothetical protein